MLQELGLEAAYNSCSPLIRHFDWHNQVTMKLKGRGHQQELASTISYVNRLLVRHGGGNQEAHVAAKPRFGTKPDPP